jgi:hypothetical protein
MIRANPANATPSRGDATAGRSSLTMRGARARPKLRSPTAFGGLLQRKCACGGSAGSGHACEECRGKALQRKMEGSPQPIAVAAAPGAMTPALPQGGAGEHAPPIVHDVLRSPGAPLDRATRGFMERRFGHSFADVRVHADATAAASARAVHAQAYTVGRDIVFDSGRYAPQDRAGRGLLAHELTHVVQQRGDAHGAPAGAHEQEADAAARSVEDRPVAVRHASGPGLAKTPNPGWPASSPGSPLGPRVTPQIEQQLIQELQNARMAAPKAPSIPREAIRTFAVAAVIKPNGSVTFVSAYFDQGMVLHAEPQLLAKLESKLAAGDMVAIAIDQLPCNENSANCQAVLRQFRIDPSHGSLRVYVVRALRKAVEGIVTRETATPADMVRPKRAIQRPIGDRFLVQLEEFRRIRLPMLKPGAEMPPAAAPAAAKPSIGPPATGAVAPKGTIGPAPSPLAPKPGAMSPSPPGGKPGAAGFRPEAAAAAELPDVIKPRVGFKDARRWGVGALKLFGPAVLDIINRYTMAKEEAAKIEAWIAAKLESPDMQRRVAEAIDRRRLDIARQQYRGRTMYVSVQFDGSLTNDVLNRITASEPKIEDRDRTTFMRYVHSHGLMGDENSKLWVIISAAIGPVETSESEQLTIEAEALEEDVTAPMSREAGVITAMSEERNRTLAALQQAEKREAAEREAEIDRPAVIADPKKRDQQQQQILGRLQQMAPKQPAAPKKVPQAAPAQQPARPAAPPALMPPQPGPAAPQLLPGAPGAGPIQIAAGQAKGARSWTTSLKSRAEALRNRVGSADPPSHDARRAMVNELKMWRLGMKAKMNEFTAAGRSEAANEIGALIDEYGRALDEIRTQIEVD